MPISSEPVTPAALRLLLMLCRSPAERIDAEEAASLCSQIDLNGDGAEKVAAKGIDETLAEGEAASAWPLFLKLAEHHRVLPLVAVNARRIRLPASAVEVLRTYASRNAIEAFRWLTETQRLLQLLSSAGVNAAVLKGVPLSLQAYGDVATRDVGDIDLLIHPEEAEAADGVLQDSYLRKDPEGKLTPRRRASYARHFKDYTYEPLVMQAKGGFEIDLHWRLFRNPLMPGNALAGLDSVTVTAGSMQIKTLARPTQLVCLAVQGAVDGWTRLKALADVAALWNACDKAEVLELAREAGVLPYLFAALALADGWIGSIELPEGFRIEKTLQHPLAMGIVVHARQTMLAAGFRPALRETSSWATKRYEASLYRDRDYKWAIARRVLFRPRVWKRFDLPDALFPLYPLLSPVEWVLFHLGSRQSSKTEGRAS